MPLKQNAQTLKEIKLHGTSSFHCAFYQTSGQENIHLVKHHWHDEIEILHFSRGGFYMEINMEGFTTQQECLCFVNPGELHRVDIVTDGSFKENAVVFNPNILDFTSYDTAQVRLIQPLINQKLTFPHFICATDPIYPLIFNEYSQIVDAFTGSYATTDPPMELITDSIGPQLRIKASLLKILAELSDKKLLSATESHADRRIDGIKSALTYIQSNYKEKIYIGDLAMLVNMNEQYFCRFFKKAIGKSPVCYINEYRIHKATSLLLETDLQVMDICLECGFNNLGNFLREFRKYTSLTPLQYRKSKLHVNL